MKIDCDHIGYEVSWEDSLLDVVDNFIHRVFQRTVFFTLSQVTKKQKELPVSSKSADNKFITFERASANAS